jgi:hypothetical protein
MTKRAKTLALIITGGLLLIALFIPHQSAAIPEWRVQVLDETGRPVAGVSVHE